MPSFHPLGSSGLSGSSRARCVACIFSSPLAHVGPACMSLPLSTVSTYPPRPRPQLLQNQSPKPRPRYLSRLPHVLVANPLNFLFSAASSSRCCCTLPRSRLCPDPRSCSRGCVICCSRALHPRCPYRWQPGTRCDPDEDWRVDDPGAAQGLPQVNARHRSSVMPHPPAAAHMCRPAHQPPQRAVLQARDTRSGVVCFRQPDLGAAVAADVVRSKRELKYAVMFMTCDGRELFIQETGSKRSPDSLKSLCKSVSFLRCPPSTRLTRRPAPSYPLFAPPPLTLLRPLLSPATSSQ
jgi:hypothetical protein